MESSLADITQDDPPQTPPPLNRGTTQLSRDQRRDILLMHNLKKDDEEIATYLNITLRQVTYTLQTQKATPRKRSGRPGILTPDQIDVLISYVTSSKKTRRLPYQKLSEELEFNVSAGTIKRALHQRGYHRRVALRKPPITETNRVIRLTWAYEHLQWSHEQWATILWSDETWVTGGSHRKTFVTRRAGEELNPDCIEEKIQRKPGWMFWGCFANDKKGPSLFWEKEWGTINKETYCARIVPLICGWLRLNLLENRHLRFMQDNAPGHAAASTHQDLHERGIYPIFWPAFSPDLNPIETIWNRMKDWLVKNRPARMKYDELRDAVNDAWISISAEELKELVGTMHDRCVALIEADGGHIPY